MGGDVEFLLIAVYTVTTRMTLALRCAAMASYFKVSLSVRDKITRQCPTYVRVTRSLLVLQYALMQSQVPLNESLGPRHYRPADNRGIGPPTDQSDRRSTTVDRCLFISRSEHGKGGKWGVVIDGSQ